MGGKLKPRPFGADPLQLNLHRDIWPHVTHEKTISLKSKTITSLLENEQIEISKYDALVMDTQGTVLLILKGAIPVLKNFTYIRAEAANFESYKDCCRLPDITDFLSDSGCTKFSTRKLIEHLDGGYYYDVIYYRHR